MDKPWRRRTRSARHSARIEGVLDYLLSTHKYSAVGPLFESTGLWFIDGKGLTGQIVLDALR